MPDFGGPLTGIYYVFRGKTPADDVQNPDEPGDFEGGTPNAGSGFQGETGAPGEGGGITPEYQQYLIENNLHVNPDGSEGYGRDNRHFSDVNPDLR